MWYLFKRELTSVELKDRIGIEAIDSVLKINRMRWFGHVERKEEDWLRKCMYTGTSL